MCHNSRFSRDYDFCIRASSEISRKFFQSLRFVCNHSHVGSRRALCDFGRKSKIRKFELYAHICQKLTIIGHNSRLSRDFRIFGMRAEAIFQYLRFVCNRAHVRSHRAPCDFGRKSKIQKYKLYADICQKSTTIGHNSRLSRDFRIFGMRASYEI